MELTGTFHALVDESVEQRTTVVTEGWAGVGVDLELVLCSWVLKRKSEEKKTTISKDRRTDGFTARQHFFSFSFFFFHAFYFKNGNQK